MFYLLDCFHHKFYNRFTYSILLIIGLACCCIVLSKQLPLRLNFSGSMPLGMYWISHIKPKIGDWVAVCLPDRLAQFGLHRGYLHAGSCSNHVEPLFKQIAAMSGDIVSVNNNDVAINGLPLPHSATLAVDTLQRALASYSAWNLPIESTATVAIWHRKQS